MRMCADCHSSHAHLGEMDRYTEAEFRYACKIAGYDRPEGTKSYKGGRHEDLPTVQD